MSDTPSPQPEPLRPASTVMLVRDGSAGLEIFMVARQRPMDGAMGALVFPGGKVDAEDGDAAWNTVAAPQPAPERPFWIAAVRETFEEAGILIGRTAKTASLISPESAHGVVGRHRERLLDRALKFHDLMREESLAPALDCMVHFAHWQTPVEVPNRRFDTHFFLVAAPEGQLPKPDGREMVDSFWVRPSNLLAEVAAGQRTLVPATRFNLEMLAASETVADAMGAARNRRVVTVLPRRIVTADGPRMVIPEAAGYPASSFRSSRG